MLLSRFNVASTTNVGEMIEGIRARSSQFTQIDAKPSANWRYVFNRVQIGSVRIGVSQGTHVSYRQDHQDDIVITGLIAGVERMRVGSVTRSVSSLASLSPRGSVRGEVVDGSFWTVRLLPGKLAEYLTELELDEDIETFIAGNWLTPLATSARFTAFIMQVIEQINEFGAPFPREIRAIEDLIYINSARLLVNETRTARAGPNTRTFARCLDYIDSHLSEDISVLDLARVAGLSVRSLQYIFNNETNGTVTQFLRERRLQRARQMLQQGHPRSSVQLVAAAVGIGNPSYFAKLYRSRFGEPPAAVARRHR
jgi:AraC-like DNA-binding protein